MDPKSLPKILYIEDTPAARALVRRVLARDFVVLEAEDALSGIELAIQTRPDLILLDINLPQLSGREVAARLKTQLPNSLLIAFSADTSPKARERALASGCVGYLTKPLDVDIFPDQIREFLGGKREILADQAVHQKAFEAELVERLEEKVRELTKTAERNAYLNEQNKHLVVVLRRRQRLLEAAARVSQVITSILDLDELLRVTVDVICEEYGIPFAGIFLLDAAGESAVLRAGSGEAGARMVAEGYRRPVGGDSTVGSAIRQRSATLIRDVDAAQASHNPYLPGIRSRAALPLIGKDAVLGALSVQSDQLDAFSDDDLAALQTLASQVAVAINNAQLLRDLHQANHELLRTKTFQAIAQTTGETIHWVGNKAAPIPSCTRRVREDLLALIGMLQTLMDQPPEGRPQHPLWPAAQAIFDAARRDVPPERLYGSAGGTDAPAGRLYVPPDLESILEDLAIIEQSAATILAIKEDLIGPVRLQHLAEIELPALLEQTLFEMGLPPGVVHTHFAADLPSIRGDSRQIGQVFNNLVKNAWEALAGRPQPRITVTCHLADDPQYLLTQVADNGPGIPPELLDKIWVSFFTTKGDRGGTGLGLSACVAIINQAEGKISVESQAGAGTTFSVLLPVSK